MVSHAGAEQIPGGFGVTIFFFLSGYLITTLLRREWEKMGNISLKNFYLRRVYRIFPPLYIVLVVVGMLVVTGALQVSQSPTFSALLAQIFFGANYYGIFHGQEGFLPGTSVQWSLAVEEHFYLVFSFALAALFKVRSYRQIVFILLAACVVVFAWRLLLVYRLSIGAPYTYKATDARLDSILWGCILALFYNPHLDEGELLRNKVQEIAVMICSLGLLAFCLLYRDPSFRETFRYTLQGVALFPLFWLAVRRYHWIVFRPLNWRLSRWIGQISYTLYLVHLPAYNFAYQLTHNPVLYRVFGITMSVAFASAMYILVERPLMERRRRLHREQQFSST